MAATLTTPEKSSPLLWRPRKPAADIIPPEVRLSPLQWKILMVILLFLRKENATGEWTTREIADAGRESLGLLPSDLGNHLKGLATRVFLIGRKPDRFWRWSLGPMTDRLLEMGLLPEGR